ncbi:MAG: GNAT family N-acetyltransferase [Candidatus Heimdallarchaeota archaeon]|nr:GNAT family N-acetyltransferase [Candidatus Heimdallarchaeota archaeon]
MVSFETAVKSDKENLKKTLLLSFMEASKQDFGVDTVLPPGVKDGSQIENAFQKQTMYSIKDGRELIGGIIIELRESKEYYLQTLWIIPKYQSKKIGHKALEFIETNHPYAESWILETPKQSKRNIYFYEKNGYKKFDEKSFNDGKIVLVFYRKKMKRVRTSIDQNWQVTRSRK